MSNAHLHNDAPELAGQLDLSGDEYALPASAAPSSLRGFRAGGAGLPAPETIALGDATPVRVAEHAGRGIPDARRNDAGLRGYGAGESEMAPSPEHFRNERTDVVLTPEAPPARPRQGFTGADPARAAQAQRPTMIRPFDKAIAEHPGPVLRVDFASPLAARPPEYDELHGGLPGAMGRTGTRREGIGPGRNSFRIMPKAWDALLVDTGGPAVSAAMPDPAAAVVSARGRSFR